MKRFLSTGRYLFTAMLLLFSIAAISQKKEFTGYYLNLKGDTIKGVFKSYKQWINNPNTVSFTSTASGSEIQLTPTTCKSFVIDNYDTYVAYHGTRLTNPIDFNNAQASTSDAFETITTFLRQVASTENLRLYVYKEISRFNLFYAENNKGIIELQQKGAIINNNFWESMTFKQQLKQLFSAEKDQEKIDQLTYTEESIGSFVDKHNQAKRSPKNSGSNNDGVVISAGASLNSLKFSGDNSMAYSGKDYPTGVTPVVAVGYIFSIQRNFDKFFLFPQVKISSFKHSATTFYNSTTPFPAQVNTFQSSPTISVAIQFGYNIINNRAMKLYIAPGGGMTILVKNKQTDRIQYSATEEKTIVSPQPGTTYLLGAQAGLLIMKKYLVWASYSVPTTITSYSAYRGNLTTIQFGIGYKL